MTGRHHAVAYIVAWRSDLFRKGWRNDHPNEIRKVKLQVTQKLVLLHE